MIKKQKKNKESNKPNKKVIIQSILALICLALTYFIHWFFIIPAIYLIWLNQKELFKK